MIPARRLALLPLVVLLLGQAAAPVVVIVRNVQEARGSIRVAICTKAEFLQPHCSYVGHAPALKDQVRVVINGVPPGDYAAQAYHDANDNQVLDRNWLGIPEEGMGFSNDAPFRFGPPAFDDAAFSVGTAGVQITFSLRYFDR